MPARGIIGIALAARSSQLFPPRRGRADVMVVADHPFLTA
jgi:hypothetical protein